MVEDISTILNARKRSVGITVFGWIEIGFGIIILSVGLFVKIFGSAEDIEEIFGSRPLSLFFMTGFAVIFAAYYLLKLKNWARVYHLILCWLSLIFGLFFILSGTSMAIRNFIWPIYNTIFIYYFLRPGVKEQFEEGSNDILQAIGVFLIFFIIGFILGLSK